MGRQLDSIPLDAIPKLSASPQPYLGISISLTQSRVDALSPYCPPVPLRHYLEQKMEPARNTRRVSDVWIRHSINEVNWPMMHARGIVPYRESRVTTFGFYIPPYTSVGDAASFVFELQRTEDPIPLAMIVVEDVGRVIAALTAMPLTAAHRALMQFAAADLQTATGQLETAWGAIKIRPVPPYTIQSTPERLQALREAERIVSDVKVKVLGVASDGNINKEKHDDFAHCLHFATLKMNIITQAHISEWFA